MHATPARSCWIVLALLVALAARAGLNVGDDGGDKPAPTIAVPAPTDERGGETPAPVSPFASQLVFKNGDQLHGQLQGIPDGQLLVWQREDTPTPVSFRLPGLYGLKLVRSAAPVKNLPALTRVHLSNGDTVLGEVVSLDEAVLRLRTPYAGDLVIQRLMVTSIQPAGNAQRSYLYEGPNDMQEWVVSGGEWKVRRGVLTGFGRAGCDVKLPDRARIRCEVRWPGRYSNFSLALYSSDLRNSYLDSYHLTFGGNSVALHRRTQNQGTLNLGQVEVPFLMTRNKARLEILTNKEESKFALLINDELIKEWNDPQGWAAKGTGIVLNASDSNARISLANLTVAAWDGKLGSLSPLEASQHDMVQFANFDRLSGDLLTITNGKLAFKTPYATMDIPLARVDTLAFGSGKVQRARRYADDVELYFPTGDHLTVRLKAVAEDRLTGYSENYGDATFAMATFVGLRFNLYDDDAKVEQEGEMFEDTSFQDFTVQ